MNASDWQTCNDPEPMIRMLPVEQYQRELRLFGVACVRRVRHLLPDACRKAVDTSERFAIGEASVEELVAAFQAAEPVIDEVWSGGRAPDARAYATQAAGDAAGQYPRTAATVLSATQEAASAAACAAAEADPVNYDAIFDATRSAELAVQASLLRELVPYPHS